MPPESLKRIPFDAADEAEVRGAADWLRISSVFAVLSGSAFTGLLFVDPDWMSFLAGPPIIFLGTQLWRASGAFRKVADTDTADQEQVIQGFDSLHEFFMGKVIVIGFTVVFVAFHGLLASL